MEIKMKSYLVFVFICLSALLITFISNLFITENILSFFIFNLSIFFCVFAFMFRTKINLILIALIDLLFVCSIIFIYIFLLIAFVICCGDIDENNYIIFYISYVLAYVIIISILYPIVAKVLCFIQKF